MLLQVCSMVEVLDRALHSGMVKSGVDSFVQVGVEMESDYLDCSMRNNSCLWTDDSIAIHSDVRDVYLSENTPLCEILVGGIPCVGASKSGRSKNKLEFAEGHNDAGALFVEYLNWLRHVNPCVAIIENVGEYANTASMSVIRSVFNHLGYVVHETVLDGWDYGALEHRKRLVVVAMTPGIGDSFSFENLKVSKVRESCINDILDPVPLNDESWKKYDYLAEKEARDIAAGKGFVRQLLTGKEDGCGTIGAGYKKGRSTEPFLVHPEDPTLSRLFNKAEHERLKGIPAGLTDGVSETTGHEICGQSVSFPKFVSVGEEIGRSVMASRNNIVNFPVRSAHVSMNEVVGAESDKYQTGSLALLI
ncbi:DNA cytosine methyltransferase [Pseudomonas sp. NBRC 111132]|uniref:DNA cytosine methyltransferase n=1 Tax=Pseudomonas sp. NBRC 111132 TaxID=1661047 RepID=UPI00210CF991|nr:DNA cytosine methyltransferase [Pseudomonas sp. NBRC 111132]